MISKLYVLIFMVLSALSLKGQSIDHAQVHTYSFLPYGRIELKFQSDHKVAVQIDSLCDSSYISYSISKDTLFMFCDFKELRKSDSSKNNELYVVYKYFGKLQMIGKYMVPLDQYYLSFSQKKKYTDHKYYRFWYGGVIYSSLSISDSILNFSNGGSTTKHLSFIRVNDLTHGDVEHLVIDSTSIYYDWSKVTLIKNFAIINRPKEFQYFMKWI